MAFTGFRFSVESSPDMSHLDRCVPFNTSLIKASGPRWVRVDCAMFCLMKTQTLTCCTTRPLSSSPSLMLHTSYDVTAFIERPREKMRSESRVGIEPSNPQHHFPPVDHVIHLSKQTKSYTGLQCTWFIKTLLFSNMYSAKRQSHIMKLGGRD